MKTLELHNFEEKMDGKIMYWVCDAQYNDDKIIARMIRNKYADYELFVYINDTYVNYTFSKPLSESEIRSIMVEYIGRLIMKLHSEIKIVKMKL